jgi:hypothetical protein
MEITVRGDSHSHQRPQERRVGVEKRGGKASLRYEVLLLVEILEDSSHQLCALNDSGFDEAPLVRGNQQRNDIDTPSPTCPERIAIYVVRDPILANAAFGSAPASYQLLGSERPKRLHHVCPVRSRIHAIG